MDQTLCFSAEVDRGIVNRVTKKGQIGEDFGSIDIGFDTFGAYDFSFDVNTPLSENMALRINAHNDYLENHRDYYDGDRYGLIRPKIKLSDKTTLDLSYEHATMKGLLTGVFQRQMVCQ